jgi:hypothetical protein
MKYQKGRRIKKTESPVLYLPLETRSGQATFLSQLGVECYNEDLG